jgi:hypothetical protein
MNLSPYNLVIQRATVENSYIVVPNAPYEIRHRDTATGASLGLANIYADPEGNTPITQTGATVNGRGTATFYADAIPLNAVYDNGQQVTIPIDVGVSNQNLEGLGRVIPFDTLEDAINETNPLKIFNGAVLNLKERTLGNGGGAMWDVVQASAVTPNTYNIVQCVGVPSLALVLRMSSRMSIKPFGTSGGAINAAQKAINEFGGGELFWGAGTYETDVTIAPRALVINKAVFGTVILKLANNSNVSLVESYLFDTLRAENAYQVSDNSNMTLDYGFHGFIFDANKENQTARNCAVKMYGRRLTLSKCIISNSKGAALWTLINGSHSGGYDYTKTKTPGDMGEIEIVDCEEEGWIFEGPADQQIGHLVMNEIGDFGNDGTTPQTSTHFPGEEIHGLRVETAMNLSSANLNGVRFGRCLYANGRMTFGNIILAGGWGNAWFDTAAEGSIDSLLTQANITAWPTANPSIFNESDDVSIASTIVARVSGQDDNTVPLIRDTAGLNWGVIKSRQSLSQGGVLFEADGADINIGLLKAKGVAVALHTKNAPMVDIKCQFDNVGVVWDNDQGDIRGAWDFTGRLNSGQVFATGIDSSPNADEESLSRARIEFLQDGNFLSNNFLGTESFDATSASGQLVAFTHGMWRQPKEEDIQLTARVSGFTAEPKQMSLYLNSFNATTVTARVQVETPATGSPTARILCKI